MLGFVLPPLRVYKGLGFFDTHSRAGQARFRLAQAGADPQVSTKQGFGVVLRGLHAGVRANMQALSKAGRGHPGLLWGVGMAPLSQSLSWGSSDHYDLKPQA